MLLLVIPSLLCACGQSDPSGKGEEQNIALQQNEVFIEQGGDTLLQSDSLLNRLAPAWSVSEVLTKLPNASISKRQPVQNRHVPGQVDTLLTIGNSGSEVRFYRLPEEDLLQYANIQDSGLPVGEGLAVGQSVARLTQLLPPLAGKDTLPEQIVLEGKLAPRSLRIRLGKGSVQQIEYQGYVD